MRDWAGNSANAQSGFPTLSRLMAILFLGPLVGFLVLIVDMAVVSVFDGDPGTQPGGILGGTILLALLGFVYVVPMIFMLGLPGSAFAAVVFAIVRPFLKSHRMLVAFCLVTGFFATGAAWSIYHCANLLLGVLRGTDMPTGSFLPIASLVGLKDYTISFGLPGAVAFLVTGTTRTL